MKRRGRSTVVYNNKKKSKNLKKLKLSSTTKNNKYNDEDSILEDNIMSDEDTLNDDIVIAEDPKIVENKLEKRLKLAKKYIKNIQDEQIDYNQNDDIDPIAARLEQEILLKAGIKPQYLADKIGIKDGIIIEKSIKMKESITCIAVGREYFFVGSKDGNIYKFDVNNYNKIGAIIGSSRKNIKTLKQGELPTKCYGHILSLALSFDFKYLASSCENKYVYIWDPNTLTHIHTFRGHRDWVSGVVFRLGTHYLYTTSFDRMVKIWNLDDMSYVDTLYGHEDKILSIDTLHKENALTAGGLDYSIRLFKIDKETQSLYQADSGYFQEYALMLNEQEFISITSNGSLLIWRIDRRKPIFTIENVHICKDRTGEIFQSNSTCIDNYNTQLSTNNNVKPIYSIALIPYSDLIVTGSSDGYIHFWKYTKDKDSNIQLEIKKSINIDGIVSCLKFSTCNTKLLVGISKDGRLGRWEVIKIYNQIIIYKL